MTFVSHRDMSSKMNCDMAKINVRRYADCNINERINFKSWFCDAFYLLGTSYLMNQHVNSEIDSPRYSRECWSCDKVSLRKR